MLDDWITRRLVEYQRSHSCDIDLSQAVKDLVPILSVGVHEIVRQVMHHCFERGVVLDKLWKAYVYVFNRVLRSMQLSLGMAEHSKSKVEGVHSAARDDLEELKRAHPEQMHKVIMDLEAQFTSNMRDIEDQLINLSQENEHLQKEHRKCSRELDIWYPNFRLYQSSYINNKIPHYTEHPSGAHQYRHGKASGKVAVMLGVGWKSHQLPVGVDCLSHVYPIWFFWVKCWSMPLQTRLMMTAMASRVSLPRSLWQKILRDYSLF